MYAVIQWINDSYVVAITNENGSLKLFDKLAEADSYANEIEPNDSVRVISIESVREYILFHLHISKTSFLYSLILSRVCLNCSMVISFFKTISITFTLSSLGFRNRLYKCSFCFNRLLLKFSISALNFRLSSMER